MDAAQTMVPRKQHPGHGHRGPSGGRAPGAGASRTLYGAHVASLECRADAHRASRGGHALGARSRHRASSRGRGRGRSTRAARARDAQLALGRRAGPTSRRGRSVTIFVPRPNIRGTQLMPLDGPVAPRMSRRPSLERRERLLQIIASKPGIHTRELARECGLALRTARYHVDSARALGARRDPHGRALSPDSLVPAPTSSRWTRRPRSCGAFRASCSRS